MSEARFTFVDLFAGIGGFRLAMQSMQGSCVGFSEIAPDAIDAYCKNYGDSVHDNLGDITKLSTLPPHDMLTGGVPCQSWSIAGKNLGFDDSRGQLWNDALYLLGQSRPKAFIFENVKGLSDPRNKGALEYIMETISRAGYNARCYLLNAYDYGVPQNRVRIYIIGFRDEIYFNRFHLPPKSPGAVTLGQLLNGAGHEIDIFEPKNNLKAQSISVNGHGLNDYFLFNDLRNGATTVHSWDIHPTTAREKGICMLILQNRRKRTFGPLDGNPLSLLQMQGLDSSIKQQDIDTLTKKGILKAEKYRFSINPECRAKFLAENPEWETFDLGNLVVDAIKQDRRLRISGTNPIDVLELLEGQGDATCIEVRYDFKNTKISTGLDGINRIFLPSSKLYPTLVASDTRDYITDVKLCATDAVGYKAEFLEKVYRPGLFRPITKEEACAIQGFPADFILPASRPRWMKLIGNSVAVKLVSKLVKSIVETGVFKEDDYVPHPGVEKTCCNRDYPSLFG